VLKHAGNMNDVNKPHVAHLGFFRRILPYFRSLFLTWNYVDMTNIAVCKVEQLRRWWQEKL